jgi:TolB-like protein
MRVAPFAALLGTLLLVGGASAGDRTRIVILPIVVHSAASDSSYVSRGITDMISARLEQTGQRAGRARRGSERGHHRARQGARAGARRAAATT